MNLKITLFILLIPFMSFGQNFIENSFDRNNCIPQEIKSPEREVFEATFSYNDHHELIKADALHLSSTENGQLLIRLTNGGAVLFLEFFNPEVLTTNEGYLFRKGNKQIVLPATVGSHDIYHLCTAKN